MEGSFRESQQKEIRLLPTDDMINSTSFRQMIVTLNEAYNLAVTAQYFQVDGLLVFCETKICEMLDSSNAIDVYNFADRYFLKTTKQNAFEWMLFRLFPVAAWDELDNFTIELCEKLMSHPRLVVPNEMYLYHVLKMLIQLTNPGWLCESHKMLNRRTTRPRLAFLLTDEGAVFRKAFKALRLGNILVQKENVEVLLRDNIIPRKVVDHWIMKNWMSLVSIESPSNFGPTSELVSDEEFEAQAMRFGKIVEEPNYHSWKFIGFSYGFDMALFFDGRTLIIKRVHQINEHKISHSHLLRRIMIRWTITEMNTKNVWESDIQTITMTTNEELCLKQLKKEPQYPCRISVEVFFHVPYKSREELSFDYDTARCGEGVEQNFDSLTTSMQSKIYKSYKRFFQ